MRSRSRSRKKKKRRLQFVVGKHGHKGSSEKKPLKTKKRKSLPPSNTNTTYHNGHAHEERRCQPNDGAEGAGPPRRGPPHQARLPHGLQRLHGDPEDPQVR